MQVVECEEDRVLLAQRREDPEEPLHDPGLPPLGRGRRASLRSMAEKSESGNEHRKQRAEQLLEIVADEEIRQDEQYAGSVAQQVQRVPRLADLRNRHDAMPQPGDELARPADVNDLRPGQGAVPLGNEGGRYGFGA